MDLETYNLVCIPLQRVEKKLDTLLELEGYTIAENGEPIPPEEKEKITENPITE